MTAYVAIGSGTGSAACGVVPNSFEIRILQIIYSGIDGLGLTTTAPSLGTASAYRYSTGVSGGTSTTPTPLRQGTTAASTTAKTGSVAGSGSAFQLYNEFGTGATVTIPGPSVPFYISSYRLTFQPATDVIISPGSALLVGGSIGGNSTATNTVMVYFEELRLSWPY